MGFPGDFAKISSPKCIPLNLLNGIGKSRAEIVFTNQDGF